jgi:exonuclease III
MKILSWNISNCGTQKLGKEKKVKEFGVVFENEKWDSNLSIEDINNIKITITGIMDKILDISPDIIIIQEFQYQMKDFVFPYLTQYNYHYDKVLEQKIARNGVLVATKGKHEVRENQSRKQKWNWININWNGYEILGIHILVCKRWNNDGTWEQDRTEFWEDIIDFKNTHHRNCFIIGDFNTTISKDDGDKLLDLLNDEDWYDADCKFERPTYIKGNRLDYVFCTSDLQNRISRPMQVVPNTFSDHCLIVLDIQDEDIKKGSN